MTFRDNHFRRGQAKSKIFVKKTIHCIKIQNIQPNIQFLKIRNIYSKHTLIFLKSRIFIKKIIHFF